MAEQPIQFNDGAAYERMMGRWSRLAGDVFLDWLAIESRLRRVDLGCGNGAFTEAVIERCAPSEVAGVDPSQAQLEFARMRAGASFAQFQQGDAMSLPQEDDAFDVAAMALVLFFVPDPAKGLAEIRRVVTPGGMVSAYAWDILSGGVPRNAVQEELRATGLTPPQPPSVNAMDVSRIRHARMR
jgi:ubiquinone/menaquinone biosynthesis C-methylase UbiE